jgi:ABC-type transporter Mla MlaB component
MPFALSHRVQRKRNVLRISICDDSERDVRLVLEGRLVGPWVHELRKQSEQALSKTKSLTLDLGKLWFVDPSGAALLRELAERQVEHVNCSIFISQQLKEPTL